MLICINNSNIVKYVELVPAQLAQFLVLVNYQCLNLIILHICHHIFFIYYYIALKYYIRDNMCVEILIFFQSKAIMYTCIMYNRQLNLNSNA